MNNVAFDLKQGKPLDGDLVWSALPGAPVVPPRARHTRFAPIVGIWKWIGARAGRRAQAVTDARRQGLSISARTPLPLR